MSMKMLTALQLLEIFSAYAVMTLLVPALLLYKKISGMRFCVRFMIYQSAGNFYMITLVLILQLLHISNWFTLFGTTVAVPAAAFLRMRGPYLQEEMQRALEAAKKLAEGKYGGRLLAGRLLARLHRAGRCAAVLAWKRFWRHPAEVLLVLAVIGAFAVTYGVNAFAQYSYGASDIVVHNDWINSMGRGKLFAAGVYPFGFHCVIYFLHTVFRIETYVLLRLFWVVQALLIHLMLLAFVRLFCKTRFLAYAGLFLYLLVDVFQDNTYSRFFSSLPQEFGMMFILPSAAFLFLYLENKKQEGTINRTNEDEEAVFLLEEDAQDGSLQVRKVLLEEKRERRICICWREAESFWYLCFFVISFSLTLTVHFYNTITAGILCLGIACGYCFRLFRRPYFVQVMAAGVAAVVLAVLPMACAVVGGTPLEGSLYWGLRVLDGTQGKPSVKTADEKKELQATDIRHFIVLQDHIIYLDGKIVSDKGSFEGGRVISQGDITVDTYQVRGGQLVSGAKLLDDGQVFYEGDFIAVGYGLEENSDLDETVQRKPPGTMERIMQRPRRVASVICDMMRSYLLQSGFLWMDWLILASVPFLALLSVLFFCLRQMDYAARLMSAAVWMGMLTVVLAAANLGLPELMETRGRTTVYYAYLLIVLWCFCADSMLSLLFGRLLPPRGVDVLSLLLVFALAAGVCFSGTGKKIHYPQGMQLNDAVLCLTNIMREEQDDTWTIVSANDELHMGEDHGFHYEIDTFLRSLEQAGGTGRLYIPTQKVYFFIEKVPVPYSEEYAGSGQSVSVRGADQRLPDKQGIEMYKGERRWVEMSRMYYWAQQFVRLFPKEFTVYYESEEFVCYCARQNPYSLFNFSIDYVYNMKTYAEE
ncbi:MAG: hypothetical protein K2P45_03005 [Eubacterium sp.]|nr:hypothetical protein [Eubacterium sp.]